jgi:hypothetical protein
MSALPQEPHGETSVLMMLGCVVKEVRALRAEVETLELPPHEAGHFHQTLDAIETRALALLAACGELARVH